MLHIASRPSSWPLQILPCDPSTLIRVEVEREHFTLFYLCVKHSTERFVPPYHAWPDGLCDICVLYRDAIPRLWPMAAIACGQR